MIENMIFDFSGLIKDKTDKAEIEYWGHDAGEFIPVKIAETPIQSESDKQPDK